MKTGVWSVIGVLAALVFAPSVAAAQQARPAPLVLVTEQVERDGAPASVSFWWSSSEGTTPTPTDARLFEALSSRKVDARTLEVGQKISRVYRAPHLSVSNAAALAALLGIPRAVVGSTVYEVLPERSPFGQVGVRVSASLTLVDASGGDERALATSRTVWGSDESGALGLARTTISGAMARLIARALTSDDGPVGVDEAEARIVLSGLPDYEALREVRVAIEAIEGVERARVRWFAEGRVALEINPGVVDTGELVGQIERALMAQRFARFSLRADPTASSPLARVLSVGAPGPITE